MGGVGNGDVLGGLFSISHFIEKKKLWPEASVVDDCRNEAEINFGLPLRVAFLDYPLFLFKFKNISARKAKC